MNRLRHTPRTALRDRQIALGARLSAHCLLPGLLAGALAGGILAGPGTPTAAAQHGQLQTGDPFTDPGKIKD